MSEPIIRLKGTNINLCVLRDDEEAISIYTKWFNDSEIIKWTEENQQIMQFNDIKEWLKNQNNWSFSICTKNGNLIGKCSIWIDGDTFCNRNYAIGIMIGEETNRNKGYGTESLNLIIKYAFEELNAHRVNLTVRSDNTRALKCYKKVGFKIWGTAHDAVWCEGGWKDNIHMEILETDYYNNKE